VPKRALTCRLFVVICAALFAAPLQETARAEDARELLVRDLPVTARGIVTDVIDGAVIRIEGIDVDIRLVSIQAPKLPKGRAGFTAWPLANEARGALASLVQGRVVTLHSGDTPFDRNGRILAHLVRDDGLWIQNEMLRLGWARVYTFADNRRFTAELYASERAARAGRRGIWNDPYYAIRQSDPQILAQDIGTFQIVEGRVTDAAKVRGRVYLNFGEDYRSDFTATIPPDAVSTFTRSKFDPLALEGKVVRVRGYLRDYNGPVIDITHPEQIDMDLAPQ
jgi:micrococcal nuclease